MSSLEIFKPTKSQIYPRIEGNNICTWIGFKHVMYVVEEAVVDHLRQNSLKLRDLYEKNGLCFEIVDSDARILHALHMDDKVSAKVSIDQEKKESEKEVHLHVNLHVERDGESVKAVVCRVSIQFKLDDSPVTDEIQPLMVENLALWTVEKISRQSSSELDVEPAPLLENRGEINADDNITDLLRKGSPAALIWKWRIPYFYCHYNERMKHSGYLRLLEEVEDLFLADNNISIRTMLHEKKWIPVVPSARAEILEEAYMEETLYTVYSLVETYRDFTYTHRMDCYVVRDGKFVKTATGSITHGYARINDRSDWSLVAFDDETKESIHKNLVTC
jgi:acyl-CoA thioesterase FadM